MSFKPIILALGLLGLSGSVFAADIATVRTHLLSGDYAIAAAQAELLPTAEAQALAAEALLSDIMLGHAEDNRKQAKKARDLAEAALELDPTHQNARLQYAIADGFITRETGDVAAWMKRLPQKTEVIVQTYRSDFPDDVRGDALMGAWHLAIVRKAGEGNAKKWFGASISDGRAYYNKAVAFKPDDAVIGVNYAFSLIGLDDKDMPDVSDAKEMLEHLTTTQPEDHLNQTVLKYARGALERLDDRDAARDYVGLFLDGKKPE